MYFGQMRVLCREPGTCTPTDPRQWFPLGRARSAVLHERSLTNYTLCASHEAKRKFIVQGTPNPLSINTEAGVGGEIRGQEQQ